MSIYLHFSGVLIGIQGAFLVFAAVIIIRRELEWRRSKPPACRWCTDRACDDSGKCTCLQPCGQGYCKAPGRAVPYGSVADEAERVLRGEVNGGG